MPVKFDSITIDEALKLLPKHPDATVNEKYYLGDHWQDGDGWMGPVTKKTNDSFVKDTMQEIKKVFVSVNAIKEVIERHVFGLLGREPYWELSPRKELADGESIPKDLQTLIDEAEAALTEWWDEREIHQGINDEVAKALYAEFGVLRLYVPTGLLVDRVVGEDEEGNPVTKRVASATTLADALRLVWLDNPARGTAGIGYDEDTKAAIGIFQYTTSAGKQYTELTYLDENRNTVIRTISSDKTIPEERYVLNLGGRLTMYQIDRKPLITEQVRQSQKALNLAATVLPRNVITSGFLERVLLNAQLPGEWVETKDAQGNVTGRRFIKGEFVTGAGTTNALVGTTFQDESGNTKVANPSVVYREPVDVKPTVDAKRSHYLDILEQTHQAHIILSGEAIVSGKSREQARADFMASLKTTRKPVEPGLRWIIETALALAELFSGQPGKFSEKLRCVAACRPDYGPMSPDERAQNNEAVDKGALSRETAMFLNGNIDDVDAELAKINSQNDAKVIRGRRIGEALTELTTAGLPVDAAAELIGLEGDELDLIVGAMAQEREREDDQKEKEFDLQKQALKQTVVAKPAGPRRPGALGRRKTA